MDASIKLWNLNGWSCACVLYITRLLWSASNSLLILAAAFAEIRETLKLSERWDSGDRAFPTAYITDPDFTTSKVWSVDIKFAMLW